ncbi:MAG TPA: MFS transporter [Magnetospirillum sp.]|nr:MFS transporter [Magnetospirillum sp.]
MARPAWLSPAILTIFVAGCVMMSVSMGARQAQGLLMGPLSAERGWPLATFSLAVALHNLFWGAFQPFTGAAADRWGAARVAAVGALAFGIGMMMVAWGGEAATIIGLGLVSGFGLAATSYSVVLGPVGRAVAPQYRTTAMGTGSALGSLGMMAMIPLTQGLIGTMGAGNGIWVLACFSLATIPLALMLHRGEVASRAAATVIHHQQSIGEALREAWGHSGYRLLIAGFFVCGFQLAFISVHLPGYLALCGMTKGAGATALLVIGGFNVIGTYTAGRLRLRPKYVLSAIYLARAVATFAFVMGPKNEITLLAYAAIMGLLWLSTVPPTTGLIAGLFGPRYIGMLFGVVFFSHQIGSFLGAWLGGIVYDATLSYDAMWMSTVVAGVFATLVHLPIKEAGVRAAA